jgi:RNA polymerase sigma factor (sigma-70 family)
MNGKLADRSSAQPGYQQTTSEVLQVRGMIETDRELEQRLLAGDDQTLKDLPALLQPRMLRRAYQYVREYRHILPAYLEALDLVQEASLAIWKHLEDARTKESPLGYLVAAGYQTMRNLCLSFTQEPRMIHLDQPCSPDDKTPLREYIPSSVLPVSPYTEKEDEGQYAPLYDALALLPESQRSAIERIYGMEENAVSRNCEIRRELGWTESRIYYQKNRALTLLALALQEAYPQYTQPGLLACIPEQQWKRLEQACAELQAEGRPISARTLFARTKAPVWTIQAYLRVRQGGPPLSRHERCWQKLDQAYADLQSRGEPITPSALHRATGSRWVLIREYLKQRSDFVNPSLTNGDIDCQLLPVYADLQARGERVTPRALSKAASVSYEAARAYLRRRSRRERKKL